MTKKESNTTKPVMSYWKNINLNFVIEVIGEAELKFKDESSDKENNLVNTLTVEGNEAKVLIGTVIHDPKEIWGVGYKSDYWAKMAFKPSTGYNVIITSDAHMWEVTNYVTGDVHEGGYYETGSDENRDYRIVIEWDTPEPENREFIESLIEAYI